ncbi:hypothetical protein RFI_24521 [Reticulomyxa filosa]|uniref:Uncharacterized protein n=1 Tax=Reticulomyxa filosa TaxID=46433 RepID=X6MIH3_RETFI|nr:hypothetical protein RFI_24521 [Reticulomyxa filosa]|eukprot:ETO12855.1 hypothetical protein RFI_24521 [Reticulomyxa filosa]
MLGRINKYSLIIPSNLYPIYSDLSFDLLGNVLAEINGTWKYVYGGVKQQMCVGMLAGVKSPIVELYWDSPSGQMYSTPNDIALFLKWLFANVDYHTSSIQSDIHVLSKQTLSEWMQPAEVLGECRGNLFPWKTLTFILSQVEAACLFFLLVRNEYYEKNILTGAIEGYNSMLYFSPLMKFGGVAYYAEGGLTNNPIWGDVLNEIYKAFDIMINYLSNNNLTPVYPSYVDAIVGVYQSMWANVAVNMSVQWFQKDHNNDNSKFVGILTDDDNSYYRLVWDNRPISGGNDSIVFYLETIGNNSCEATGGNMEVLLEKDQDTILGFYSPSYWTLHGPRFWTKVA